MAGSRKDKRGRVLKKGELQRKDGRYAYSFVDPLGRRKYIYATDLATLRKKEQKVVRDQLDGLDIYVAGRATINMVFDRYISLKYEIKETTKVGYIYTYNHFVKDNFGQKRIADVKFSDVVHYYNYLLHEKDVSIGTLESIHCLLHPTFDLAVRDDIIRKNPTDGVMKEVKKKSGKRTGIRHALTIEQQRAFMNYIANSPVYYHWWPLFTVLLGTGCRIGEAIGLRWEDINYDTRTITINHSITYFAAQGRRDSALHVSTPKTEAGVRTIPMLDAVYDAFKMEYEECEEYGFNKSEVDGYSGFIFKNRYGEVPTPASINRAIKRICASYNAEEVINAKKEKRESLLLPNFSCHHLRHTFATRLCEQETNLKVIQSVMGHRSIETTMDIYAEATEQKKQESFVALSQKLDVF